VILGREHRPFDNHLRSSITTHRVDGDFRHMSWDCLTLLDLEHGAATIKAAVRTGAVR